MPIIVHRSWFESARQRKAATMNSNQPTASQSMNVIRTHGQPLTHDFAVHHALNNVASGSSTECSSSRNLQESARRNLVPGSKRTAAESMIRIGPQGAAEIRMTGFDTTTSSVKHVQKKPKELH